MNVCKNISQDISWYLCEIDLNTGIPRQIPSQCRKLPVWIHVCKLSHHINVCKNFSQDISQNLCKIDHNTVIPRQIPSQCRNFQAEPSQYGNLQAKFHCTKPGILPTQNINCTHHPPQAPGPIHTKHTVHTIQVPYRITFSNIIYQTYLTNTGRVCTKYTQHTQGE